MRRVKEMAKSKAVSGEGVGSTLVQLDPAVILADDNTRFGLKQSRVESLAQSILERGEVLEPVEVEALGDASSNGHSYRLTTGFYRLAAVSYLNTNQAAGLKIPAIVRATPTPQERLRRQLAENMERENQSPMDQAVAIKRLLDSGLTKMEVRTIFSRPGGRKGNKVQPASNSFINMTLSFLDLPKAMQTKIHEGLIGVAAAYELTKVPAERRAEVLERAEAERQKGLEREEREEERLLAQEKKSQEANEKRDKALAEVSKASEEHKTAVASLEAAHAKSKAAYEASIAKGLDPKVKKENQKAFKVAGKLRLIAEADALAAQKVYEDLQMRFTKSEQAVAEKAAKLKEAKAQAPAGAAKKGDAVGPSDVKKAAVAAGATTNYVPLNKQEIHKFMGDLALPGGNEKVVSIAKVFIRAFAGEITDKQAHKELMGIVG